MASHFIREIIFQLSVIDSRRFQILSHVQNFGLTYIFVTASFHNGCYLLSHEPRSLPDSLK